MTDISILGLENARQEKNDDDDGGGDDADDEQFKNTSRVISLIRNWSSLSDG
jgi:hypothetical protein